MESERLLSRWFFDDLGQLVVGFWLNRISNRFRLDWLSVSLQDLFRRKFLTTIADQSVRWVQKAPVLEQFRGLV